MHGRAGVGKTRLLAEACAAADSSRRGVVGPVPAVRRQRLCLPTSYRDGEPADGYPLHGWLAGPRRLPVTEDLALAPLTDAVG
ncbi:MAG TPA: hypothetical protein VF165_08440 [Nocardioidaceae bacterium]